MKSIQFLLFFFFLFFVSSSVIAQQGFLHADGQKIVDGNGENVILRGIGTGNWMLMEGYMMKTSGFASTQHEITKKLETIIGKEKTDEFFDEWLKDHFTKTDVDSMKAWGFNSIRVAMHYIWFTPPIEDEPVAGEITWRVKGFTLLDSLLSWCSANEMYLILDLHGAPGGQGKDAAISDYDSSKPSLWESQANKDKTVALWRKLAERYSTEAWIGGYDLINETNWTFPEGNNSQLRKLFGDITTAIREVDQNHILFIEGNSYANDHSGLTPPWDDNMAYSFHKYWSGTSSADLNWVVKDLRDKYNVPLWLGESGENSNVWFTELITSLEENNIGWSWWPVKKNDLNCVLSVPLNAGYEKLLNNKMSASSDPDETFEAIMQWAENHKIENCEIKYDVIDALIRQPHSNEVKAFVKKGINDTLFFSDYDLGALGYAYDDKTFGNYGGDFVAWNTGWSYRSDGVDIESCSDQITNGYSVGWIENDEWIVYTIDVDSSAAYSCEIRYAANSSNGKFHLELNGVAISPVQSLPTTGGWATWQSYHFDDVILPAGQNHLKFYFDNSGFNLNYFTLSNPHTTDNIEPQILSLETDAAGEAILLVSNLGFDEANLPGSGDFSFKLNNESLNFTSLYVDSLNPRILVLETAMEMIRADRIYMSYTGDKLLAPNSKVYPKFANQIVENLAPNFTVLPGKVQAEAFAVNNGFNLEDCTDTGGGQNLSYANPGDYVDYPVFLYNAGEFQFSYRVASQNQGRFKMQLISNDGTTDLHTITASSGGWQTWKTQTEKANLPSGKMTLRILVLSGEFNLNWFQVAIPTSVATQSNLNKMVFTHEAGLNSIKLHNRAQLTGSCSFEIMDLTGRILAKKEILLTGSWVQVIDDVPIQNGWVIVRIRNSEIQTIQKLWMK